MFLSRNRYPSFRNRAAPAQHEGFICHSLICKLSTIKKEIRRTVSPGLDSSDAMELFSSLLPFHLKIIHDRKNARHTVGTNSGNVLVALIAHYTFQGHMAILHDNVNWRDGLHRILKQTRISEELPCHLPADAIVIE